MEVMKELLQELELASAKSNKLDEAWDADPMNEELEKAWDEAYKAEHEIFMKCVEKLVEITNGQIDIPTATTLLRAKKSEVKRIFSC
jgi:hypothetical protein